MEVQMQDEYELPDPNGKMDILFYNSIKRKREGYIIKAVYQFFIALILVVFIIIDPLLIMDPNKIRVLILIILGGGIVVSILNTLIFSLMFTIVLAQNQENNIFFLRVATLYEHSVPSERFNYDDAYHLQNCVSSNIYDSMSQTTLQNKQFFTDKKRKRYEKYMGEMILQQIYREHSRLFYILLIGQVLTFLFIAGGILILVISYQPHTIQIIVISVAMFLSALLILRIFIFMFICLLAPIGCLIYFCVVGCRSRRQVRKTRRNMPGPQKATPELLRQSDGQCAICLQDIRNEQSVIVLHCATKHIFHDACIKKWALFKPTCPVCRRRLDQ